MPLMMKIGLEVFHIEKHLGLGIGDFRVCFLSVNFVCHKSHLLLHLRIEHVADAVTEQVEPDNSHEDEQARNGSDMRSDCKAGLASAGMFQDGVSMRMPRPKKLRPARR